MLRIVLCFAVAMCVALGGRSSAEETNTSIITELRAAGIVVDEVPCFEGRRRGTGLRMGGDATDAIVVAACSHVQESQAISLDCCLDISEIGFESLGRLSQLKWLSVERTRFSNKSLDHLRCLKDLRSLYLSETMVDDDGLRKVSNLHSLTELGLSSTQVHGNGLVHLRDLRRLRALAITNLQVDDRSFSHLAGLPLTHLFAEATKLTDASAQTIGSLGGLRVLSLAACEIGDAGVSMLSRLHELETLDLTLTNVSSIGLIPLAGCSLQHLVIDATAVDDAVIDTLNQLQNLRTLHINETRITEGGIARLQLPNLVRIRTTAKVSQYVREVLESRSVHCDLIISESIFQRGSKFSFY